MRVHVCVCVYLCVYMCVCVCVCVQAVLNVKSEGNGKLVSLKRRVESVCEREALEDGKRRNLLQSLRDTDDEWRGVLQAATEQHRYTHSI